MDRSFLLLFKIPCADLLHGLLLGVLLYYTALHSQIVIVHGQIENGSSCSAPDCIKLRQDFNRVASELTSLFAVRGELKAQLKVCNLNLLAEQARSKQLCSDAASFVQHQVTVQQLTEEKNQALADAQRCQVQYAELLSKSDGCNQVGDEERKLHAATPQRAQDPCSQQQFIPQRTEETIRALTDEVRTKTDAIARLEKQLMDQINAMQQQAANHFSANAALADDARRKKRQCIILGVVGGFVALLLCAWNVLMSCALHHRGRGTTESQVLISQKLNHVDEFLSADDHTIFE